MKDKYFGVWRLLGWVDPWSYCHMLSERQQLLVVWKLLKVIDLRLSDRGYCPIIFRTIKIELMSFLIKYYHKIVETKFYCIQFKKITVDW